MSINMQILYALEKLRVPFLEYFFTGISYLGSEITAAVVVFVILWCVDKRKGYFILSNVLIGTGINQAIKLGAHVARPFVAYEDFSVSKVAKSTTGGFSFPSGHTQSSTSLFGSIASSWNKKGLRIFCAVMILLVAFSRLYLGCHYPTDVLGGFVVGLVVLLCMSFLFSKIDEHPVILSVLFLICGIGMLIVLGLGEFGAWRDFASKEEMPGMLKGVGMVAGIALAAAVCEPVERKYICYDTKAVWWAQILKVVIGFAIMGALAYVMKYPSAAVFGDLSFAYVPRLFVAVVFGMGVWPMTFDWFAKLGRKDV